MNHLTQTDGYAMAEAEVKISLSEDEPSMVLRKLEELSFQFSGSHNISDYYIEYRRSSLGGWEFKRLRSIDDCDFLLTEKRWELDGNGNYVRIERECTLSENEYKHISDHAQSDRILVKTRDEYQGRIGELPVTVCLDALHISGSIRHFIECEAIVVPSQSYDARISIKNWLTSSLGIQTRLEAPSMLELLISSNDDQDQANRLERYV